MPRQHSASEEQVSFAELLVVAAIVCISLLRFGSGFTLQLKVKPVDNPPVEEAFSRRTFSFRSMSSPSRASTASPSHMSHHSSSHSPYDTAAVQQFVTTSFPGARLLEKHQVCEFGRYCASCEFCEQPIWLDHGQQWPCGPTDKASDYGSEDSRFESWQGRFLHRILTTAHKDPN